MRRILWLLLLVAATSVPAVAQSDIATMRRLFDYDKNAPLDIKVISVIKRDNVRVHDIYLRQSEERTRHGLSGRACSKRTVPIGYVITSE